MRHAQSRTLTVTMKKLGWLLTFISASIGKRPIASISAQELLLMLRRYAPDHQVAL